MASASNDPNLLSPASPSGHFPSSMNNTNTTSYPSQALTALETYKKKDSSKVVVRFKAIGNAPIMKNNYFRITAFNRFQAVIQFLRKELGWKQSDALVSETQHALRTIPPLAEVLMIALSHI
jgi:ubiquitin-like protein ATG12